MTAKTSSMSLVDAGPLAHVFDTVLAGLDGAFLGLRLRGSPGNRAGYLALGSMAAQRCCCAEADPMMATPVIPRATVAKRPGSQQARCACLVSTPMRDQRAVTIARVAEWRPAALPIAPRTAFPARVTTRPSRSSLTLIWQLRRLDVAHIEGKVEHVLFHLRGRTDLLAPGLLDVDVAGRAGAGPAAFGLDAVDQVLVGRLHHGHAGLGHRPPAREPSGWMNVILAMGRLVSVPKFAWRCRIAGAAEPRPVAASWVRIRWREFRDVDRAEW